MQIKQLHPWSVPIDQAVAIQNELRRRVERENRLGEICSVAGVDVSTKDVGRAAVVLLSYPDLTVIETALAERPLGFPYVPGLLSFREAPVVLAAFQKLRQEPDLIMVDGQGIAHPRRFGIASHLGVLLDKPTIGCAKSILVGRGPEPAREAGAWSELKVDGEVVGAVVRTRDGVKPVYVSIGHKIDLPTAIHYVLACARGYRLPEPTRLAHKVAGEGLFS